MTQDTNKFESIQPVAITPITANPEMPPSAPQHTNKIVTYVGLVAAILIALAVIFVLPEMIADPVLETPPVATQDSSASIAATPVESPWQTAQLAKARRDAQDILAQLMEKQRLLENKQISLWADETYQLALDFAKQGDANFRQREFVAAQQQYQSSLTSLTELERQIEPTLAQFLTAGELALSSDDASAAIEQFTMALAIEVDNASAQRGLARAQVLPEVMVEIFNASNALENGDLSEAKRHFQSALGLDANNSAAQQGLQAVATQLQQQNFISALSSGYGALEQRHFNDAISAFKQAIALKPSSSEAKQALTQAQNQRARVLLNQQLSKAESYEQAESWRAAEGVYAKILNGAATIIEARIGHIRSRTRAELDEKIQKLIKDPLRLSSSNVFSSGQQALQEAHRIKPSGPRLTQQTSALARLLTNAATAWPIRIASDNRTNVTLFRVGKLGQFDEKILELKPGNYIAAGSRSGYRDVRIEFQITGGGESQLVVVRCQDPI